MASSLSKDFFELIKAIGESKSKQEEERIIVDEVKALKVAINTPGGTSRRARELLVRLIYVEMLGHDASWGYVVAVQQTASHDLSQKRAGYLACGLMLAPDHDFRFMLVNQMQRDLASANVLECSAALVALCKLVTLDMVPALISKVGELLEHDQTLVRKKAVMALHRFYQLDAGSVAHLAEKIKAKLRDRDPSVMGAALCLLHDMARVDPASQSDLVDQYVSILKQITEHRLPREFDHHRMPAPWLQIKLLQLLATLGNNDKRGSEAMYEVLGECMRRADTGTNIGYAVVYEVVKTITTIWPDATLLDAAASAISRFITSDSYNLKYLGVTGLAAVVREHPKYAAQHQMAVIECLEDPDETLKRKTLELLFRMTNPANAEVVVDKLLGFLKDANDQFLRTDLVARISQLAERYSPDNTWYIETMTRMFTLAGDLVDAEVAHNVLRLLAEGASNDDGADNEEENFEMRSVACRLFVEALQKPVVPVILLKVAFWTLGEYAYLLSATYRDRAAEDETVFMELDEAIKLVCDVVERATLSDAVSRCYGVSAVAKMTAQLGRALPCVVQLANRFTSSPDMDLQQRCRELRELLSTPEGMAMLREVLPVDASCEDFDDADFGFLAEFVEILRAAGAPEYAIPVGVFDGDDADDAEEAGAQQSTTTALRYDAYEPPSVFEPVVAAPPPAVPVASAHANNGHHAQEPPRGPTEMKLATSKSVWGPQGYTGNLSGTLGGAMAPANVSSAAAIAVDEPVVESPPPPPSSQLPVALAGAGLIDAVEEPAALSPPPPPLPKKPERVKTEKEKMADALFGTGGAPKTSRRRGGTSAATAAAAPAPAAAPTGKSTSAPEMDLLGELDAAAPAASSTADLFSSLAAAPAKPAVVSMDDLFGSTPAAMPPASAPSSKTLDLLSLSSPPATSAAPMPARLQPAAATAKPAAPTAVTNNFMDFSGVPAPVAAAAAAGTAAAAATTGTKPPASNNLLDLFSMSPSEPDPPASPAAPPLLTPKAMNTAQFGSQWGVHTAEKRLSVGSKGARFGDFLPALSAKLGVHLVEHITATGEAILCGAQGDQLVLLHSKDKPATRTVDFMVRSKSAALTDRVAEALARVVTHL